MPYYFTPACLPTQTALIARSGMGYGAHPLATTRIRHFVATESMVLSECLRRHFGLSAERVQELLTLGAIYSQKRRVLQDRRMERGEYLRIHLEPKRFPINVNWEEHVIAKDPLFVVVRKPFGIPVHATLDNAEENCLSQLRKVLRTPLFVTQRLDIPVGGLLLFARTPAAQAEFNRQLAARVVEKTYCAVSKGEVAPGLYRHFMQESERSPKIVTEEPRTGWLPCELRVLRTDKIGELRFEMQVELLTGRTHQIRAQMSYLGAPLVGDSLYGSKERWQGDFIQLFSTRLAFQLQGKAFSFEASAPWRA